MSAHNAFQSIGEVDGKAISCGPQVCIGSKICLLRSSRSTLSPQPSQHRRSTLYRKSGPQSPKEGQDIHPGLQAIDPWQTASCQPLYDHKTVLIPLYAAVLHLRQEAGGHTLVHRLGIHRLAYNLLGPVLDLVKIPPPQGAV